VTKMLDQTLERIREKARQGAHAEGSLEARRKLAIKLLARGHSVAEVAELTELPEDEVRALAQ